MKNYMIVLVMFSTIVFGMTNMPVKKIIRPKTAKEFAYTAVKLINSEHSAGGSGVILSSEVNRSIVLTNRHVCEILTKGGVIIRESEKYRIESVKISRNHDLCLVKTRNNLNVNTVIAEKAPELYADATISGFPALLPHVTTRGNFSEHYPITLPAGMRECTPEDIRRSLLRRDVETLLICSIFNTLPAPGDAIDSQLITALIMGGSSGSGIFNADGEISALVFAGFADGGLSFGFAVPHKYIKDFVKIESNNMPWTLVQE